MDIMETQKALKYTKDKETSYSFLLKGEMDSTITCPSSLIYSSVVVMKYSSKNKESEGEFLPALHSLHTDHSPFFSSCHSSVLLQILFCL